QNAPSHVSCCLVFVERNERNDKTTNALTAADQTLYNSLPLAPRCFPLEVQIGPHLVENNLVVAPMAGVTDRPFRQLCKRLGAGLAVSEMIGSNPKLRETDKSKARMNHEGEVEPIVAQIAGADPSLLAEAARYNADRGAQIIDIN